MRCHVIEGVTGCEFARANGCVAIVVDALRASATAAMLFHHGALSITAVRTVTQALAEKSLNPNALLFGERGGLPPDGFDYGNSPRETEHAAGRDVIFTTTNGAQRLVEAWGAEAVYMATTTNAAAAARCAVMHARDIVLVPAGQEGASESETQEDWAAAAIIAGSCGTELGEGADALARWLERVQDEGLFALFQSAPHAESLRRVGLDADIEFCALCDLTDCVPRVVAKRGAGVRMESALA